MAVNFTAKSNVKQSRDNLGRFIKAFESKPYAILIEEAARAQEEVWIQVPIKTGRLKMGSTIAIDPTASKLNPKVIGEAVAIDPKDGYDYSNYQHDHPELNHPNGGKAFFIRDPFNDMTKRIDRRFKEELGYDGNTG